MATFSDQVRAAVYREHDVVQLAGQLVRGLTDGDALAAVRLAHSLRGAWETFITSLAEVAERRRLPQRAPLLTPCALCGHDTCMAPYTVVEMSQISSLQL
jgi:hypothetical protein